MNTIKVIESDSQKMVEITPAPVQQPTRKIPVKMYVRQITARKNLLQTQLNNIEAELEVIKKAGVDIDSIK